MIHGGDTVGYEIKYGRKAIDFSANISPLGLPEGVKKAVINSLENADKYPDPLSRKLREKLSTYFGINEKYILCGNGAADLIFALVFALKPKKALLTAPTFAEYEEALNSVGADIEKYILKKENNFLIDESFIDSINEETDIVFICQPNNPTGQLTDKVILNNIIEKCQKTNTFLVIDECFVDFLDNENEVTVIDKIQEYKNIFILKAFTKLYAMAGIRLGYGFCTDLKLIENINKCRQPWSVSYLAQEAGIAALNEKEYVKNLKELIKNERVFLKEELKALEIEVFGSNGNFIFFYCSEENFDEKLREKGIMIRDCSNYTGLSKGYYRIAVKTHGENEIIINAVKEILNK